jgi:glycosyltransferase involved in cell wall biosynthesis
MINMEVLTAAHVNQISDSEISYGPPIALVDFLKRNTQSSASISHPFSWSHPASSRIDLYFGGKKRRTVTFRKINLPEPLSYVKDLLVNLWAVVHLDLRAELFVGADGINTLAGLILRRLKFVRVVAYYSIDYTPRRFHNRLLNGAYHALDKICVQRSDYVWNLSSRMAAVRARQGLAPNRNIIVPVGTELGRKNPLAGKDQSALAFLSHLVLSKGVDLVLDAMPSIISKVQTVRLFIIGSGPSEPRMKEIVNRRGLDGHIVFLGPMSHEKILETLPSFAIGLAPYSPSPDNITWYADPTKIKDYLSCGLAVVVTDVPEVAFEIKKKGAGLIAEHSAEQLASAVISLLNSPQLEDFQKNAYAMASEYDWDRLFSSAINLSKSNAHH